MQRQIIYSDYQSKLGKSWWQTGSETDFYTAGGGSYSGSTTYVHDNSINTPAFNFYLYHSQNISVARALGEVRIKVQVFVPIDPLNYDIINLEFLVNLSTKLYPDLRI